MQSTTAQAYYIKNCSDTEFVTCRAFNGTGYGWYFVNGAGSGLDEGLRLANCVSNVQTYPIYGSYSFVEITGGSFTSSIATASLSITGTSKHWKISNSEFGSTSGSAGGIASTAYDIQFTGCYFFLSSTIALNVSGTLVTISGCIFSDNTGPDISLDTASSGVVITGNILRSTTYADSIIEQTGGDYNLIVGNAAKKTIYTSGTHTVSQNNLSF
jgi:hypothetical protein